MRNIRLDIQYDGTKYSGWQKQGNTENTIQYKIESVLSKMIGEKIEIIGSGRTDAGVHALNQVANFKTNCIESENSINDYLNKYLPKDIVVKSVREVNERFHSRYNAVSKIYKYKIYNDKYHDVFSRKYSLHLKEKLNLDLMIEASRFLIGEHDFTSFTTLKSKKKSKIRTIYSIDIEKKDNNIEIIYEGNGFLYNMVRIITGTLIEVGLNRIKPDKIKNILENKNRELAGPTAPAHGLYLVKVKY